MANETHIYVGKEGAKALYKRLKQQIANITTYQKVTNTTPAGVPIVTNPNTRTIYLVKDTSVVGDDKYKEWIWNSTDGWECIGTTSIPENAWKQWSEDNGSSGEGDSVYIGKNNILGRDESFVLGQSNTVTVTDNTDYTDTDIVEIGTSNTATNAANTYQLGRENSVSGNNLAYKDKYPHSMALNLGRNNTITGEGINVGKDNKTERFGVTVGQGNTAHAGSYAMGNKMVSRNGSIALGNNDQTGNTTSVSVPTMIINGKKYPVCKFQKVEPTVVGRVCATKTGNTYSWIEVKTTVPQYNYYRWYKNEDLNKSILAFGGYSGSTVQGYFDGNEQFVPSTAAGSKIYLHLLKVGNVSGPSVTVDFYASTNSSGTPIQLYSGYEIPKDSPLDNYPAVGTIYTESQLNEFIANTVAPISVKNDVVFDESDPSVIYTNFYTNRIYYSKYRIYGYYDGSTFIPYSKLTAYQSENWVWEVKDADEIGLRRESYRYNDIFGDDFEVAADSNSIAIGANQNVSTNSIGIAGNEKRLMYTYQNGDSSTSLSNTYYYRNVLSSDGSVSSTRFEARRMVCNNDATVTDYTGTFNKFPITVEGGSLSLSTGGDDYVVDPNLATYVTGRSISIGSVNKSKSGSIAIGSKNYAEGGSHIIGTSGNVTGGSFGYGNSLALEAGSYSVGSSNTGKFGSYAIGTGLSVSNGSFAFGSSSVVANGSMSLGFHNKPDNVGYSIGQYNKAYWRSITLAANEREVYPPLEITNRKVFIYTNPDGVEVPVQGQLRPANGGTIEHVLAYFNVTADGKTIPVVEIGKIEATVTTYGIPQYYDESTHSFKYISSENLDVSTYTLNNIYKYTYTSGGTVYCEYSQNYGYTQAISNMLTANPMCTSSVMHGLLADKPSWFEIEVQAYTTGDDTYVYSYTKSYSYSFTTTYINLSKCTYKYAAINQTNINYYNWNTRLTPGGFNSSIAIGTRSHANGSSLAIGSAQPYATNSGCINGDLVFSLDSERSPNRIGYPTKLYYIPIIEATGGSNATTTADSNSIAVGDGAVAENTSISFGRDTRAYFNAIAYGVSTYAQQNSIALGITSLARENSYSSGMFSTSAGNSIAIGWGADASNASTVFGKSSSAWSDGHVFGVNSIAYDNGFVYGRQSKASRTAVVAGINSRASQYSSAFGVNNMALAGSTSVGSDNQATGGSIAAGVNSKAINTSGVLGNRNIAYGQSFALGFNNTVNGWSLAVGVNNISADAAGAHATLIGYNNTSTSTKENHVFVSSDTVGTNPNMAPLIGNIATSSILMGNLNKSEHYNSILIGIGNYSHTASSTQYPSDCRDDDGFVLAIGRENEVGRNYDIAIGYKSIANGGENVAVQHSVAGNGNNTFHNLAMFNSTAYGTGNVALQDSSVTDGFTNFAMFNSSINGGILNIAEGNSTLDVGKLVGTSSAQNVYANMLSADSRLVNVATSSIERMQKNRLFSSNVDTCQRMGYNDFFVSNVNFTKNQGSGIYYNLIACNGQFENSGDRRPIPFVVDVPTYHNNILFGNRSGSISVTEFNRNVVLQPRDNDGSYWMNWNGTQAADNFLFGHQVQGWFGGDGMYDNVIMNSRLTGSIDNEFVQNVMLARSIVKVNTTDNVTQSFLFNAGLTLDDTLRKTQTHSTQNALFNCTVKNSSQVFVFGFGDDAFDSEYQSMNCTWRTVAFGDNKVDETCDSFLFGSDNRVEYTHETTIFGRMNNLLNYSIDDYGKRDYVKMGGNKVVGSKNELTNDSGELSRSIVIGDSNSIFAVGKTNDNKIIGSNNTISGGSDTSVTVTNPKFVEEFTEKTFFTSTSTGCINTGDTQSYVNSPYGSSSYFYYLYSNGYLSGYQWDYAVPDSVKYTAIEKSTTQLRNDYNNGVLIDGMWYKVPGGQSSASFSQPIVKGFVAWKDTSYYFDGETVRKVTGYSSGARYTYRNTIIGSDNYLGNNVSDYFILGKSNKLTCNDYLGHETDYTISTGFIQGNNNTAKNGSNIVCMGNGNVSTGHNSTAIGTQLISSQWQTVIGKYNAPIDGATRLDTENPQDPTKALFIIGNGYSQKDDETYWQDESYITRSNAMVVYADGTVRAKKFVSDAPDLELVNGTGITFTDSTSTNTRTVSVSQDLADLISFLDTRPSTGRYAINSINGVLTWVEIGTTGV